MKIKIIITEAYYVFGDNINFREHLQVDQHEISDNVFIIPDNISDELKQKYKNFSKRMKLEIL